MHFAWKRRKVGLQTNYKQIISSKLNNLILEFHNSSLSLMQGYTLMGFVVLERHSSATDRNILQITDLSITKAKDITTYGRVLINELILWASEHEYSLLTGKLNKQTEAILKAFAEDESFDISNLTVEGRVFRLKLKHCNEKRK